MQYANFTKDDLKISRLGYGLMRLPVIDGDNAKIDYKKSEDLVQYAIENGINYLDTAYTYHNDQSEIFLGQILSNGLREKIYLATKNPIWKIKEEKDFEKFLDIQLKKLQTDYIDFYLLHSLDRSAMEIIKKFDIIKKLDKIKKDGYVKYVGFSFHDNFDLFKEMVDCYDFDFVQLQLNYLDEDYQVGMKGLKYARGKDLSTIIMEPLRGGQLVRFPDSINKYLDGISPAEAAFSYLYDMEDVDIVLSGMNEFSQIKENIEIADKVSPTSLNFKTKSIIENLYKEVKNRLKVRCTGCNYCEICPQKVNISGIFEAYNEIYIYEDKERSVKKYKDIIAQKQDASRCVECGSCENVCPQHLNIIEDLKIAESELTKEEI